jgi:hypothetical protein
MESARPGASVGTETSKHEEEDLLSDSDNSDEDGEGSEDEGKKKRFSLGNYFRKKQKKMVKMLMDYGPPYTKMESGITLLDECALPEPSLYEIHSMLNQRLNPNFRDPEDYYNSSMHWCARHAHYRPMKLLRRAKADTSLRNEFGQTPLHVICMMVFPADKRKRQLKTFNFLLEQGAEINIRDKGGYCPIDYAAMNGHEAMVAILLERGAEVLRDNHTFVATRQPLLHIAVGPVSRRLIRDRIDEVILENHIAVEIAKEEKAVADDIINLRKRHARIARKRVEGMEKKGKMKEENYQKKREEAKVKKLEEDYQLMRAEKERMKADRHGRWTKPDKLSGRWHYEQSERPNTALPPLQEGQQQGQSPERYLGYNANLRVMNDLRDKYDFRLYNERWKKRTGNNLEIEWKKDELFHTEEDGEGGGGRGKSRGGGSRRGERGKQQGEEILTSLDEYNENDKELEGENIDDLLNYV